MRDWKGAAALGRYLGILDDRPMDYESMARQAARRPEGRKALEALRGAAGLFEEALPPAAAEALLAALEETDFAGIGRCADGREERLWSDVHRRFASRQPGAPGPGELLPFFREYLRRFALTLEAALGLLEIGNDALSLGSPAARRDLEELRRLPCRQLEATSGPDPPLAGPDYAQAGALLQRLGPGLIADRKLAKLTDLLDRLAARPGYLELLERERRLDLAGLVSTAIKELKAQAADTEDRRDLLAALGLLLFSLAPSPALIKLLLALRPGQGNRQLLYGYNLLLALNLLQLGKRELAATFSERALEAAPGPDGRAYARALQACAALKRGRVPEALMYLEKGQEEAAAPRIRSMLAFYLGIVLYDRGEARQALERFREARRRAATDADGLASGADLGACCLALGDPGQALRAFEDSEALGERLAKPAIRRLRAAAAGGAGIAYANLGEPGLALRCFQRALRAYREAGDLRGVANQLINIGLVHRRELRLEEAARHLQAALGPACADGYGEGVLFARRQLREALALQGRYREEAALDREISRRHPGSAGLLGRAARKSF